MNHVVPTTTNFAPNNTPLITFWANVAIWVADGAETRGAIMEAK